MLKKFTIHIILFFIPVIIICALLEKYTRELPMPYTFVAESLEVKGDSIKVVAFGSSQMNNAFNPEWLTSPSLNMASSNQHLDTDFKLYQGLKGRLGSLETVVLELSYAHFEMPHNGKNFWKNHIFLEYYDVNCFERSTWIKDHLIYFSNPPFFSGELYESLFDLRTEEYNSFGFNTNNFEGGFRSAGYDEEKIASFDFKINTNEAPEIFRINTEHFNSMLDTLRNDRVRVVIVTPPMYKAYLSERNPSILRRRDSILSNIEQEYENVRILRLEEDRQNFTVMDYLNHNHLNPDGARKFTSILNEFLQQ